MRSERLRWLVAAEGPFASVYFDDSHDTLDAVERREATWRDVRKHLESRDAKQELIDSLEEAVRDSRPAVGQRGRALIATGEQVLVNEHLIGPPPATVIRLSDYPYVVPLIDLEMRRPTYVFAAVDHTGADVKLYQGATISSTKIDGVGYPVHKPVTAGWNGYGDVDRVYDPVAAAPMGLAEGTVCVMIHTGSRGLGHQICTDHVRQMEQAMGRYGIAVPDRQLACVPVHSPDGQAYLAAMAAAANYGRANRQLLTEATRRVFADATGTPLDLLYDVSHNLAKIETHPIDGQLRSVCVHRKGATRSLPPHHHELPAELAAVGQPVLIPGTMGTASYVLAGVTGNPAFFSTAHGAGRVLSRHQAARHTSGEAIRASLAKRGIIVRGTSRRGIAEEKPEAYKDVDEVIEASHQSGLARKVARLVPLGCVKG